MNKQSKHINRINIEIDTLFDLKNVQNVFTYNNVIISNCFFLHLMHDENCYILKDENKITIEIWDSLINTGVDSDFVKFAIIEKLNNLKTKKYFLFIKKINIISKCKLELVCSTLSNITADIIQSPLLILKVPSNYKIENYSLLHPDSKYRFIFNNDYNVRFNLLNTNKLDATWPANGNIMENSMFNKKIKENFKFINNEGKNYFIIYSYNKELLNNILCYRDKIQRNVIQKTGVNQLDSVTSYIESDQAYSYKCIDEYVYSKEKKATIAFSNYYPNELICKVIKSILENIGWNISLVNLGDLQQFLNESSTYDAYLKIISPTFFNDLSIPFQLISDLPQEQRKSVFLKILSNDFNSLYEHFHSTTHTVPLFKSRNIYWQSKKISKKLFDQYGRIIHQKV